MLTVKTEIKPSRIHGRGLFAAEVIAAGAVVWVFAHPDRRIPLKESDENALHYGYINPENPHWLVQCGDGSRFWNFSATPNCAEASPPTANSEAVIIAARTIFPGEELTIGVGTDADASRKLGKLFALVATKEGQP